MTVIGKERMTWKTICVDVTDEKVTERKKQKGTEKGVSAYVSGITFTSKHVFFFNSSAIPSVAATELQRRLL